MKDEAIDKAVDKLLAETGEMSKDSIEQGGENYEWAQYIETAAKRLEDLTDGEFTFDEMKPFDQYQGPYASGDVKRVMPDGRPRSASAKLWSTENEDIFYFEGAGIEITGTIDEITDAIVNK